MLDPTSESRVVIYGAGGHARVVIDALEVEGKAEIIGVIEDDESQWGQEIYGYPILGGRDRLDAASSAVVIGIARNDVRKRLWLELREAGHEVRPVVHPSAVVSPRAVIAPGAMIMANATVNAGARLGESVVLNTGALVEHDCAVGSFSHVGPGAHLAGAVNLGEGVFFGTGATAIPFVSIGEWTTVGAGAVVTKDLPSNCVAVGVPAKAIKGNAA